VGEGEILLEMIEDGKMKTIKKMWPIWLSIGLMVLGALLQAKVSHADDLRCGWGEVAQIAMTGHQDSNGQWQKYVDFVDGRGKHMRYSFGYLPGKAVAFATLNKDDNKGSITTAPIPPDGDWTDEDVTGKVTVYKENWEKGIVCVAIEGFLKNYHKYCD
jgi:hypothetical protein